MTMTYTETFSAEQLLACLKKLELSQPVELTLAGLNTLLFRQLTHIPFDSLDIWATGTCPSLKLEDLFEKFILRGRGGYCFELNTFFRSLLNALGFDAWQVMAYILNPDGTPQPPAHNAILCRLNGSVYFCDVGYGGPVPYEALELKEGLQKGFRLTRHPDGLWFLSRVTETEERPTIAFRDIPAAIHDLIPLNFYISQRPDSHFRHRIHLSRRNADGSIYSIDGTTFKIHRADGVTVRELTSIADLRQITKDWFGMDPHTVPLRDRL